MGKDDKQVISEFNSYVNMSVAELEKWLKGSDSKSAGWTNDGGSGESVGHESGRKIIEILKANPSKTPDKYSDEHLQHMRKVASYCKRHLAQEASGHKGKSEAEIKKTKSYISLKNWGHDLLKSESGGKSKSGSTANGDSKSASKSKGDEKKDEEEDEASDNDEEKDKKAGDKRKKSTPKKESATPNKKQETSSRQTRSSSKKASEDDEEEQDDDKEEKKKGGSSGKSSSKNRPKKGDTVSWSWGSGNPKGKVLDVKEDKATITTKRGNKVSRDGDSKDPAVVLDTGKSKAIKSAHELN